MNNFIFPQCCVILKGASLEDPDKKKIGAKLISVKFNSDFYK